MIIEEGQRVVRAPIKHRTNYENEEMFQNER